MSPVSSFLYSINLVRDYSRLFKMVVISHSCDIFNTFSTKKPLIIPSNHVLFLATVLCPALVHEIFDEVMPEINIGVFKVIRSLNSSKTDCILSLAPPNFYETFDPAVNDYL